MTRLEVCVTGACGRIAHSLYNYLCSGLVFGPNVLVNLRLLDTPAKKKDLEVLQVELEDCCYKAVESITIFTSLDEKKAFRNVEVVIFLGGVHRTPGKERAEVFKENATIFATHGSNLEAVAHRNVRCLVVANPTNTNALVLATNAPSIPSCNFTALTRLGSNRFLSMIARECGWKTKAVKNVVLWGNHSKKEFCDASYITVEGVSAESIKQKVNYFNMPALEEAMYQRGGFLYKEGTSFIAVTKAIIDHLHDWFQGSDELVSMGVIIKTPLYDIPLGLCFSLPTRCLGAGVYYIVDSLYLTKYRRKKIYESVYELCKERELVLFAIN